MQRVYVIYYRCLKCNTDKNYNIAKDNIWNKLNEINQTKVKSDKHNFALSSKITKAWW